VRRLGPFTSLILLATGCGSAEPEARGHATPTKAAPVSDAQGDAAPDGTERDDAADRDAGSSLHDAPVTGSDDGDAPVGDAAGDELGEDDASSEAPLPDAAAPYNPCPPQGPCVVMPLGDSITAGSHSSGGGYRVEIFHRGVSDGHVLTFVGSGTNGPLTVDGKPFPPQHEGHSGYTIDDGGGRMGISPLATDAIHKWKPDIVTLMIGTNDVDIQLDLPNAPKRLGALMDQIAAADPHLLLVVAQIVPTTDDAQNVAVRAYNAALVDLVRHRADAGQHVTTVDMYGAFVAQPSYKTTLMDDKLHPKDAGYAVMGDVWYAALASLLR
jgi:lysophospholipase L1-like esterase